MEKEIVLKSNGKEDTKRIARDLVATLLEEPSSESGASILALTGDLGSGKTQLIQYMAEELDVKEPVMSPTFLIFKKYRISKGSFDRFVHMDAYRIKSVSELENLGFGEILRDSACILCIEWAENVSSALPPETVWVRLEHGQGENERIIKFHT